MTISRSVVLVAPSFIPLMFCFGLQAAPDTQQVVQRCRPSRVAYRSLCDSAKVLLYNSVAFQGAHLITSIVLPSCSSKVVVESVSRGQLGDMGCAVTPPCASEKVEIKTNFCGATISGNIHLAHIF
jgi:hypothetical protein